jgi:predicted membrane-bound spermidine synthase
MLAAYPLITRGQPQLVLREKAYFMLTGFAYMCLQIGLISRYDLFLGNPLYAMAIVITAFLAWNGLGSFTAHKLGRKINCFTAVACALVLTPLMIILSSECVKNGLALPLAAKIGITLLSLLPIGFVLGMLFPLGIGMLNARNAANAVPAAYAFSVLSSVLGSVYALFVLPGLGYNAVMFHAVPLYAAALLIFLPVFSHKTL